jgi:hypothetical protein
LATRADGAPGPSPGEGGCLVTHVLSRGGGGRIRANSDGGERDESRCS